MCCDLKYVNSSHLRYPYPVLLAMHGEIERRNPNFRREDDIDRVCECAIRLVHLGAKFESVKSIFNFPFRDEMLRLTPKIPSTHKAKHATTTLAQSRVVFSLCRFVTFDGFEIVSVQLIIRSKQAMSVMTCRGVPCLGSSLTWAVPSSQFLHSVTDLIMP
jgi:hypothetical protein